MRQPLMLLAVSAALVLGGCSSLNPFVGTSKVKKAELQAFKPSSEVKVQWTQSVGKGGGESFVPVVRGKDVFAATADGTLLRLEDGKLKWRVQAGQSLSSGVGSDGKLVVVGTASGDILSFSAETGQPLWQAKVSSEVLAPPVVGESMVVVRSGDNRVYGFDLNDGKRKWVYQRNTPALALRNYASPVLAERFAFVGFPGGKLVALSLISGAPMWEGTVALPKGATEL
ncbi:MAG: hypothetical protein RIR00_475, partial [Pseudomonadota bacterium]